jgi:hypothetical protein
LAGISNVKHEAASSHDFLDRLGLILDKLEKKEQIDAKLLGLNERNLQKLSKVNNVPASQRRCPIFILKIF